MNYKNPSPLRYPGGKYKISKLIGLLIKKLGHECDTYVEPFAGGAGVALDLLLNGIVERIVINDSDRAIYSIWRAMTESNEEFLDKLTSIPVTIDEWQRQREIYFNSKKYSLEYGFAAFFLNRTNHSGILASGPIGGQKQEDWKLDVRFNKEDLTNKIMAIGELKKQIKVVGRDVKSFIGNQLKRIGDNAFVYFDPPYYRKGKVLYKNFFTDKLHRELHDAIITGVKSPWIVSYDDVPEICRLYESFPAKHFHLGYSLANNGKGKEVMFFKEKLLMPSDDEIRSLKLGYVFDSATLV